MLRSLLAAAVLAASLVMLTGCGSLDPSNDETVGWSAQRLYGEAKDAMASRDWAKAIKHLEKLEARYPYGRYAQQAQLEVAYCQWKDGERASAIAAADRFIKLYPNHPNVDYAWYLHGMIGLNDLRDSAERVLMKNFPNSAFLKAGGGKRKVAWWRLWDPDW